MEGIFAIVGAFGAPVVIIVAALLLRYKTVALQQKTVRLALERGEALSPETVDALMKAGRTPFDDLRRAILLIGLALAVALFGYFVEAGPEMTGIAMFPLFLGLGYMVNWWLNPARKSA